jgi:hypothetical protein
MIFEKVDSEVCPPFLRQSHVVSPLDLTKNFRFPNDH